MKDFKKALSELKRINWSVFLYREQISHFSSFHCHIQICMDFHTWEVNSVFCYKTHDGVTSDYKLMSSLNIFIRY